MKPSIQTWYILNPRNSNEILHEVEGVLEFRDSLHPVLLFHRSRRVKSKPVTYKTSRGALARSHKVFPEWNEHSAIERSSLAERTDDYGKIWSYKGQWNRK